MEATFSSRCPVCDEMIEEGDEIAGTSDDEWVHQECKEEAENA